MIRVCSRNNAATEGTDPQQLACSTCTPELVETANSSVRRAPSYILMFGSTGRPHALSKRSGM